MARLSANGNTAAKKRRSFFSSNPVMHRLDSVNEYSESDAASYGGIAAKTAFFLLFSVVGIAVERVLSQMLATGQTVDLNVKGFHVSLYMGEVIALFASVILAIVFQLLAFFAKPTTPVTGALYCVTQGYMISFSIFKILHGMEYLGLLALAITITIVLVMAVLYTTGIIRVTKKFKTVMLTLFITVISVSLLMLIGSFIPATAEMVMQIRNNFVISIGFSVIFIIIASLFLICDFATIDHVVQDQLPKKYEWQAAFGLSFTVLWLYLKVLDLIITIVGNKNNN